VDVAVKFSGGDKLKARLLQMSHGLEKAKRVNVGFLENADYPANDGGARLAAAAKRARKTPILGEKGRLGWEHLLSSWAHWQETHSPQLHVAQVAFWEEFGTSTQKPFPFFRQTILSKSPNWGGHLGRFLKGSEYDAGKALAKMGILIQGQLVDAIETGPADNAPLTAFIKGFSKRGQDHGIMKRAVDFEVQ